MIILRRVYHPTLPAWQDVPDKDVDAWADAGWRKTKPKDLDDSGALAPGDYVPPVELDAPEDPEPADVKASDSKAK